MSDYPVADRELLLETYRDQHVNLHPKVIAATYGPERCSTDPVFQSGLLRGVKRACDQLFYDPTEKLADGIVTLPEKLANNVAARALVDITNTSFSPVIVDGGANFGTRRSQARAASCANADGHFTPSFDLLAGTASLDTAFDHGSRIIHKDGRPLFLLKNHQESTAVSLADFTNWNVLFHAGMLCGLQFDWEWRVQARPRKNEVVPIPVEHVSSVTPTRLVAHAFPLDERNAITDPQYLTTWPDMATSPLTIQEVAELAADQLALQP